MQTNIPKQKYTNSIYKKIPCNREVCKDFFVWG